MFIRPSDSHHVREAIAVDVAFDREEGVASGYVSVSSLSGGELPVITRKRDILYLVENNKVVLIEGETGCGKSTMIPQFLLDSGWADHGIIAISEPNRLSAIHLAQRVGQERQRCGKLRSQISHSVRFSSTVTNSTRVVFITDELLLSEICIDPYLNKYSVIVVDEAHVRSVPTDLLLSLLKKIIKVRPSLRLLITSATMEVSELQQFFSVFEPKLLTVEAKQYHSDVYYLREPSKNYITASLHTALSIHKHRPEGDILIFLPRQSDVYTCYDKLKSSETVGYKNIRMEVLVLHEGMGLRDQSKVVVGNQERHRRIIVSTSISETSLTIPGVTFVVDSGLKELQVTDSYASSTRFVTVPISKAEAKQRCGRGARTAPGENYRLYTRQTFDSEFDNHPVPCIQRQDLSSMILLLKSVGVVNVVGFEYITPPPPKHLQRSLELLYSMNVINDSADIVFPLGPIFAIFPAPPQLLTFLLACKSQGGQILDFGYRVASLLLVRDVFVQGGYGGVKKKQQAAIELYGVKEGDHLTLLNISLAFEKEIDCGTAAEFCKRYALNYKSLGRAQQLRDNLKKSIDMYCTDTLWNDDGLQKSLQRVRGIAGDSEVLTCCMMCGWFTNIAFRTSSGSYQPIRGGDCVSIYHTSSLHHCDPPAEWIMFVSSFEISNKSHYVKECVQIENPLLLVNVAPHYYDFAKNSNQMSKGDQKIVAARKRSKLAADTSENEKMEKRKGYWLDELMMS